MQQTCKVSTAWAVPHLPDRPVGFQEVRLQKGVKQVACDALDGVVDGQDMDPLAILHIRALQGSRISDTPLALSIRYRHWHQQAKMSGVQALSD